MKQIALFTTDWNYELVGETLRGVMDYLEEHPDVSVRVFDCFGIDEQVLSDPSVYEIYKLAQLDQYDGAIVQTHQIVMRKQANLLEQALREKNIPALTIGIPLGNMPQLRSDDYGAFYHITEHAIKTHGARRLWFLKGPEQYDESPKSEARQRRLGFRAACRDFGIPDSCVRYLEGNWKTYSGEEAGRQVLASEERPDALICVNDDMAMGAVSTLREGGIRVPEDIIVTGFDGVFTASLITPPLATVDRDFQRGGYLAMETVNRMIEGEQVSPILHAPIRYTLTGTCGCRGDEDREIIEIKDRFYYQTRFLRSFYLVQDKIASAFFSATCVEDVMEAVEEYRGIFGAGHVRIYLDERYYRTLNDAGRQEPGNGAEEETYSGRFILAADSRHKIARNPVKKLISAGDTQTRLPEGLPAQERLIEYYPLRYGKTVVGVLMLEGFCTAAEMNLHDSSINEVALSLETIRQHQRLNRLNEELNSLYVTDQLTGLNNRFGIERFGKPLFDSLCEAHREVAFIFVDIDGMKTINDQWGHEAGDCALKLTAEAMRRALGDRYFIMRYGGDEFIALGPTAPDLLESIGEEIRKLREAQARPFELSASIGQYIRPADSRDDLDSCLRAADLKMYESKRQKKDPGEGTES